MDRWWVPPSITSIGVAVLLIKSEPWQWVMVGTSLIIIWASVLLPPGWGGPRWARWPHPVSRPLRFGAAVLAGVAILIWAATVVEHFGLI